VILRDPDVRASQPLPMAPHESCRAGHPYPAQALQKAAQTHQGISASRHADAEVPRSACGRQHHSGRPDSTGLTCTG
jgi:hypothetical protein